MAIEAAMRTRTVARTGAPEKVDARERSIRFPPSAEETTAMPPSYSGPTLVSIARRFLAGAAPAVALVFLAAAVAGAAPKATPRPAAKPPLDFSGTWELDEKASLNVSAQMKGAVLSVTQKGNRIWISPVKKEEGPRQPILAEEIVVDGQAYEKALGPAGMGLVTAAWAPDGKSLRIEVQAGSPESRGSAVQRSVWKVSEDRTVWVRESTSFSTGRASRARLVFHKRKR
jgi:hypothetical protein